MVGQYFLLLLLVHTVTKIPEGVVCRRRLNIRPDAPLGDKIDHYLGQGRGVARVAKVEEKQRIHPIGR